MLIFENALPPEGTGHSQMGLVITKVIQHNMCWALTGTIHLKCGLLGYEFKSEFPRNSYLKSGQTLDSERIIVGNLSIQDMCLNLNQNTLGMLI